MVFIYCLLFVIIVAHSVKAVPEYNYDDYSDFNPDPVNPDADYNKPSKVSGISFACLLVGPGNRESNADSKVLLELFAGELEISSNTLKELERTLQRALNCSEAYNDGLLEELLPKFKSTKDRITI